MLRVLLSALRTFEWQRFSLVMFAIPNKFIIAPVTGPIISLGLLMKLGWIFSREDGVLMLVKEGHSFPIGFRKNSIVAHGTISLLQDVADPVQDVNRSISAIRLTGL